MTKNLVFKQALSRISLLTKAFHQGHIDKEPMPEPKSPSEIFAVFHDNVVTEERNEKQTDFIQIPTTYGTLLLHPDFLEVIRTIPARPMPTEVQNDLHVPEPQVWKKLCAELAEIGGEKLLSDYLDGLSEQRDTHNHLLLRAYSMLPQETQDDILSIIPPLTFGGKLTHLVGAISPFDSVADQFWKKYGVAPEEIEKISDWAKITGSGVVLASPDFQSGKKSHDYITYAMMKTANMDISLHDQMVKNTCLHEGRVHGFIDPLLDHYLGDSKKYSTEGIAGALGQDNRIEQEVLQQELQDLLADKIERNTDRVYDVGYRIMPVFLTRVHSALMKTRSLSDEAAWALIISESIASARSLSQNLELTPDQKHAQFIPKMLKLLDFEHSLKELFFETSKDNFTPLAVAQFAPSLVSMETA